MQKKISRDNLSDLAQQAVNSLRRLVGSGGETLTPLQQDLVTTSKQVEERWQRKRMPVDAGTVELWSAGLRDELTFQTTPRESQGSRRALSESGMVAALEAARILSRTTGQAAAESFAANSILALLVKYFMTVPLSKRIRDICALLLGEIPGDQPTLMHDCLVESLPFLTTPSTAAGVSPSHDAEQDVPHKGAGTEESAQPAPAKEEKDVLYVDPLTVYLAALLVGAIHRADAVGNAEGKGRGEYSEDSAIALLQRAHRLVCASAVTGSRVNGPASPTSSESYQVTAATVYLALVGGLVRGSSHVKQRVVKEHRVAFCETWIAVASNFAHMDTIMTVPTTPNGKDVLVSLSSVQAWQSELLELLVEICTDDSFTLRRLAVCDQLENAGPVTDTGSNASHSPALSPLSSGFTLNTRHYEAIPPHWDTILTGGSPLVWLLASHLSTCLVDVGAVEVLEECLMGIDVTSVHSELMYRWVVMTLMLLCMANPRNAQRLADSTMFECLIALVTHRQQSVFPSGVDLHRESKRTGEAAVTVPVTQLSTNTAQLTESFMCSLAAMYFPKKVIEMLLRAVEQMSSGNTCQTDANIVEALLHVLATTFIPSKVLFFPGCGSVVCRVSEFPGRWSGYSFSTWVNPVCVWAEGSHLFSFTEDSGTSVALVLMANGRSCCLALRVRTAKDLVTSVITEGAMSAETWSHIVFSHGLSGVSIFLNGRRLPSSNVSVPFPQAPSKRHRLDLAFGGSASEPSFYGFIASMDLLEDAVSEKDVAKLFQKGPGCSEDAGFRPLLSIHCPAAAQGRDTTQEPVPPLITGSQVGRSDGVSLHGVVAFDCPDMQVIFAECGVMSWALQTIKKSHKAANFMVLSKLCIAFIATAMRMSKSDAELSALLGEGAAPFLESLKAEVLTWSDTFVDFPSFMLSAAIPRDGGRILRAHPSTQAVFSMLLERLEAVGASVDSATGSGNSNSNSSIARNSMSASSILRELSDCLLVADNETVFKSVGGRFERILKLSLRLPQECIESVVVLAEKLCKAQAELELMLRFLVSTPPSRASVRDGAAAASRTGSSGTSAAAHADADVAKAEFLRMLFDVARGDVSMCEKLGTCFKGAGPSFLVVLANGKNHTSEAIRVFSLRLLSLMLHVNRKFRESFVKAHGFEVLSAAITDTNCHVPIRLPTIDCLLQMSFDGYRPAEGMDNEMASRLSSATSQSGKQKSKKTKHRDASSPGGLAGGGRSTLPGHMPGLISRRLKVTRREYSFEVAHDFARVDDRLQFDEAYRTKNVHSTLHVPPAFQTALSVLGCLITAVSSPFSGAPLPSPSTLGESEPREMDSVGTTNQELPRVGSGPFGHSSADGVGDVGDVASSSSVAQPTPEEVPPEKVVYRVLSYLEKMTDVPQNGLALLQYPWMEWLWEAVQTVAVARHGNSAASPSSPLPPLRFSKKFTTIVMMNTRRIICKLVVLDMTRNSKAISIRRLKGIQQPSYLVRIVLEEVVRHFALNGQSEMADPRGAGNVVKNLDALLRNIESFLSPFPLSLGTEIVASISAIAVRNNSWVRMRMKNDSDLFNTRDRLAFFLLTSSITKFSKASGNTLLQLVDANASEPSTAVVLLARLSAAVDNKDVDEVETLVLLIRRLSSVYEDQLREIYRLLGDGGAQLADLLCVAVNDAVTRGNSTVLTDGAPSTAASPNAVDVDSSTDTVAAAVARTVANAGGTPLTDAGLSSPSRLPTSQVIEWCCTNESKWATVAADCLQRAQKVKDQYAKSGKDRADKERSAVVKATRAQQEQQEQLAAKVQLEWARVRAEVNDVLAA